MIKLSQLSVPLKHTEADIRETAARLLKVPVREITDYKLLKQSIDARKSHEIRYSYSVAVSVLNEQRFLKKGFTPYIPKEYASVISGDQPLTRRPVIIGSGPAGLFCAYLLARNGFHPVLLERGASMEERIRAAETFHNGGKLDPETNIQFGEGGAGTFSDGKLNTLVKDRDNRGQFVLETFVRFGADPAILYQAKPHIGTDVLRKVIVNIREEIIKLGGTVRFHAKVTELTEENGRVTGVVLAGGEIIPCDVCVLAIGHSSRDTITGLYHNGIRMEAKPFAMGVRIQHKRDWVNNCQYGSASELLPAADYKLTHTCKDGRGVYTFCMCPGGYVVNASSEPGRLAINGMSNHARDAENSNSAIVVTVGPEDFGKETDEDGVLGGMIFQRKLEEAAYKLGNGNIPTQKLGDFRKNRSSEGPGHILPVTKGAVTYTNLRDCLPEGMCRDILEGIDAWDLKMKGFADNDALLSAIESRTSSPVRILRGENLQSESLQGLYPCGEGAGYAGGIMSAAMDGMRVCEAILSEYNGLITEEQK